MVVSTLSLSQALRNLPATCAMVEARDETLKSVLAQIEKLLVGLVTDCERTTKADLLRHGSSEVLAAAPSDPYSILSTKDSMPARPHAPSSPLTEPPPLCAEPDSPLWKAVSKEDSARRVVSREDSVCKGDGHAKKSLRSVNIVDEMLLRSAVSNFYSVNLLYRDYRVYIWVI